jgi:methylenetetrahydrofolate reductase (NADPH)
MALPLSFEFFPPKTPEGAHKLRAARQQLYAARPEFCSVTYGAGGSTQEGTIATVADILAEGVPAAAHFSCIGATRARVREQLAQLQAMGVRRLVALRGDLPSGYGLGGEFSYASDLVAFIRAEFGSAFHIEVAAYPEMHPQARSPQADLQAFATKVRAGADSAITQYFFNTDAYFRFVDDAYALGWTFPSCPVSCPSPMRRSCCASPTPAAPKFRAGSGCACRGMATTRRPSAPSGWMSSPTCATSCAPRACRGCTSTP